MFAIPSLTSHFRAFISLCKMNALRAIPKPFISPSHESISRQIVDEKELNGKNFAL